MRRLVPLALALSLALVGCRSLAPMDEAVRAVERAYPQADLQLETRVSLGLLTRGLVLGALAASGDRDPDVQVAREAVRAARSVDVRTYRLVGLDSAAFAARPFRYAPAGWSPVARVRSDGDRVWVLARPGRRAGEGQMLVGVLSPDELVLVQLRGDLDRVMRLVERAEAERR